MKLTRHNGRSGKHGTYNPRHNDRRFDVENSEHIDAERARQNVYWDCYRGFTTHEFRENPEQPDFSFQRQIFSSVPLTQNLSRILIMIPFAKSNPIKLTLLRLHDMHLTSGRILNSIVLWMNYAISLKL